MTSKISPPEGSATVPSRYAQRTNTTASSPLPRATPSHVQPNTIRGHHDLPVVDPESTPSMSVTIQTDRSGTGRDGSPTGGGSDDALFSSRNDRASRRGDPIRFMPRHQQDRAAALGSASSKHCVDRAGHIDCSGTYSGLRTAGSTCLVPSRPSGAAVCAF